MPVLSEVLKANEAYAASFGAKSQLALPPARGFTILTCMDARSIRQNTRVWRKATRTLSATRADVPATTQFGRSLFRINF